MKKIENNAEHIVKQMSAKQTEKGKKENISKTNTHECVYGADNKPITTVYHGF